MTKGLSNDSKTPEFQAANLRAHVSATTDSKQLRGKVLLCRCKPTYRDSELFLVQLRVADSLHEVASAIVENLVKAGGNVSFLPAARSGEERQVDDDFSFLNSL